MGHDCTVPRPARKDERGEKEKKRVTAMQHISQRVSIMMADSYW